jgi:hypothetical protein
MVQYYDRLFFSASLSQVIQTNVADVSEEKVRADVFEMLVESASDLF